MNNVLIKNKYLTLKSKFQLIEFFFFTNYILNICFYGRRKCYYFYF